MSVHETTTSVIDHRIEGSPPEVLHPVSAELKLQANEIAELDLFSLGYTVKESAQIQGISTDEVNKRLSAAMGHLGARNRRQASALAIQSGLIPLGIEADPPLRPLSSDQEAVLRLAALGWTSAEIQARYGIEETSVDSRMILAKKNLVARSRDHAIRRAFELGTFRVGEPLLGPEAAEDSSDDLKIVVEDIVLSAKEIGLNTQNELKIVRILGGLGIGYFNGATMSNNGFSPDSPSQHTRSNVYRMAAAKVERKINQAFDKTVLDNLSLSRNYRYYFVVRQMAIGTSESMQTIEPVGIEDLPKPGGKKDKKVKEKPKPPAKPPIRPKKVKEVVPRPAVKPPIAELDPATIVIENPYLDPDGLPDLDQVLSNGLTLRSPSEVSTNRDMRLALKEIMHPNQAPFDYKDKLVVSLRFGVPSVYPTIVSRRDQRLRLEEIMEFIPNQQGVDVASVSLITGLKPEAVLQNELAFLQKHKKQFPRLDPLIRIVAKELIDLRKQAA